MRSKAVSGTMLTLLLIGIYVCFFGVTRVKAELVWKYKISSTYGTNCVSISGDGNCARAHIHQIHCRENEDSIPTENRENVRGSTQENADEVERINRTWKKHQS